MLSNNFSFLDLRGRSAKAWKIARPPPLGPQFPACCTSPNARLITGIGPVESSRCSSADAHGPACPHAHAEVWLGCKSNDHIDWPAKINRPAATVALASTAALAGPVAVGVACGTLAATVLAPSIKALRNVSNVRLQRKKKKVTEKQN